MSDNESDEENEEEEEDEQEVEEDEEEEEISEEERKRLKDLKVSEDVDQIRDIFAYLETTTQRIRHTIDLNSEVAQLKAGGTNQNNENGNARDDDDDDDVSRDVTWLDYENMDEGARADLLEKAIMALQRRA